MPPSLLLPIPPRRRVVVRRLEDPFAEGEADTVDVHEELDDLSSKLT